MLGTYMNIAVCDDEIRIRQGIRGLLEEQLKNVIIQEFSSGAKLLEAVRQGYQPAIALLDIAMDGLSGMETAEKLNAQLDVIIIFVTGVKEQVFHAFDVGAFHYLLKPIKKEKLLSVIKRAIAEAEKRNEESRYMLIKTAGSYRRLAVSDILYAESDGRKVILHMKKEVLEFYGKMDELEKNLGEGFYRCHRGYLVSLSEIKGYDSTSITISNEEQIYLAKRKYSDFVQAYCRFLQE